MRNCCVTHTSNHSSGSSGRVRGGGPRNMKSMRPPLAAIFFMTYFYRAGGGAMAPSPPPGSATEPTASIIAEASLFKLIFFVCATREDVFSLMLTLFLSDRKKCNVKNTLNHHSMNKEDILKYSEKPVNLLLSLKTLKKYGVFKRNSS